MRRKTSNTVTTFEELRRRMAEMEAKAKEDVAKEPKEERPQNQGKELDVDFDVKNTGQTKMIELLQHQPGGGDRDGCEKGKKLKKAAAS